MRTRTKRILVGLAALALVAGLSLWLGSGGGGTQELPKEATRVVRHPLPKEATPPKRMVQHAAKAVTSKKGLSTSPRPIRDAEGEIIAYRSAVLPPCTKGQSPGVLREWLIQPKEGYTIHLEEHYRPDEKGELTLEERREYAANQILVTLDASVDLQAFRREMSRHGATVKEPLMDLEKGGRIVAVIIPDVTFEAAADLQQIVRAFDQRLVPELDPVVTISRVPSDPRYSGLWGMKQIEAPEAWDLGVVATNVTVAVMDTGINYHHEDLTENIPRDTEHLAFPWIEGYRSIGGKTSADPMDDHGHGSHCAGTIAGRGDNGIGVAGVTWRTRLKPIKFLNEEGKGFTSDMILCYRYIRDSGADFVNCSFVGGYSGAEETAIRQLKILGITLACAAGNDGQNNDSGPQFPSSYDVDNIVAVASTGGEDVLSEFSNYGTNSVDIAAPGEDILSTCYSFRNADKCYATMSGTSMATPHVTGALALLRGLYPDDHYRQTIQRLLLNGDQVDSLTNKVATGMRINLRKAMLSLIPPAPIATATAGVYEDRVEVSWRPVGGATYYRLWRAWSEESENKVPLTGWTTDCSFTDTTAELKTGYHYYVKASKHADGADASPYSLAAVGYKLTPILDDWDPRDDEPETATILTPTGEEQMHGGHSLSRWDDYDWFKIDMTAGHTYRLESTGSGDLAAELYDIPDTNSTARVAFDDDSGAEYNFRIVYTPDKNGARYLRVRNVQQGTDAFYQLRYALVGWTDEFDPVDDTTVGATVIEPAEEERSHGLHSLSAADLQDLFRVDLEAGRTYVFATTGDTDTFGELYAGSVASGNLVAWDDDGHVAANGSPLNFRIVYTPGVSGTYFLKVRIAASGASAGTYHLVYSRQSDVFDLEFTDAETCAVVTGWTENPILVTNSEATVGAASFTTADTIYVKWAFNEAEGRDIAGTVTNLIEVLNANGVRIVWGHAMAEAVAGNEFIDYTTELPPLPAGGYTVRMTLNGDVNGASSLNEIERGDNVRLAGFTVVDEAKAVVSLEISGLAEVASKGSTKYSCTATLADGTTMDVQPTWCVFEGEEHATIAADGTLTAAAVAEPTTVRLRAVLNGCLAFKLVTVTPAPSFVEDPFPDPVLYPNLPMVVEATVSIDGVLAVAGDEVAAYAGPQVRGRGKVTADGHVTLAVSVAYPGEAITFKVWDASAGDSGAVLACGQSIYGMPGFLYDGLDLTAVTSDPFGVPVVGGNKYNGWRPGRIYARVTINGEPAETGDMLAVYDGELLVGKAFITRTASFGGGPGDARCTVEVNISEKTDLSFVVWDRSAEKRCGVAATMEMGKNDKTIGSSSNPVLIAADDRTQLTMAFASPGWHLVSFNILPDEPTYGNVFGGAEGVVEVRPATDTYKIGEAYWVHVTRGNTSWTLSGRGDERKEIPLVLGWNLVGYTLPRAGRIEDVLRQALVDGRITSVTDDVESYPLGGLTTMHPGKGYWVFATRPCTISYQSSGMLTAGGTGSAAFGPFGDGDDLVRAPVAPTLFTGVSIRYGDKPAAYGDCVALYDGENHLRAVGRVEDETGTASFPAYVEEGVTLTAKIWNSAEGLSSSSVREASANKALSIQSPGGEVDGLVLTVAAQEMGNVTVSFDLGEHGSRIGGGELVQVLPLGSDAVAPEIACDEGYAFDHWSHPFANVRADMDVAAVYRAASAAPSLPEEPQAEERKATVTFHANGGVGEMEGCELDFDNPDDKLGSSLFTKEGETFIGWSLAPNGSVVIRDAASAADVATALGKANGEVTLYAQWASDGYHVKAGTFVANAGRQVTVPISFDSGRALSCISVRLTYDPKLLALVKVGEGTLAKALSDDFTVVEPTTGVVTIGLFAEEDVTPGKGTLANLTFIVRDGTDDLFSDLTIADVQLADASGVKDVTADTPVSVQNGMVRVMRTSADVSRFENAQTVAADTVLGSLALSEGDAIQASDFQTPVVVSGEVSGTAVLTVVSPVNGWAGGRYALLTTSTQGLSFTLEDVDDAVFTQETANGLTTYYVAIAFDGEIPVFGTDEALSAGTQNQIRELVADRLDGVEQIEVFGPQGFVSLIADMGIAPSCTRVGTTLQATFAMPEIRITDFDPETGIVRIRVQPGEGNEIVSEMAVGYLHVYGTDDLSKEMERILKVGYDLTPYLRDETKGEAMLYVTLGTHTFLKVKFEAP